MNRGALASSLSYL